MGYFAILEDRWVLGGFRIVDTQVERSVRRTPDSGTLVTSNEHRRLSPLRSERGQEVYAVGNQWGIRARALVRRRRAGIGTHTVGRQR